jgi:hypothetical protein
MNCGQDLRPGAPVTPVPPPKAPTGAGLAASAKGGAPEPKPDQSLSFSERYRGTSYSSPEGEALLPSSPGLTPMARRRRLAIVGIVVVALVLATAAGAYAFLFAPSAGDFPLAGSETARATATATPTPTPRERATPTPIAMRHGLVPDEVEIAGCLVAAEVAAERTALDALLADIAADRHPGVSDRARALAAEVATTTGSLRTIEAFEPAQGLAVAYGRLMALESDALGAIATADDPQRLAAAAHRLAGLEKAMAAVAAAQADLLARFPEVACGAAP